MKKIFIVASTIVVVLFTSSFIERPETISLGESAIPGEEFDPALFNKLQTVEDLLDYTDLAIGSKKRNSLEYAEFLASTIRKRFYHGYSYYGVKDNWIAWLSGKIINHELNAIVIPDDILKYPYAACSQQAIVLSACFKALNLPYRAVRLNGHFVLEGNIDNKWYYFDTNLEPAYVNKRKSLNELIANDELLPSYANKGSFQQLKTVFSSITYSPTNAPIAVKAKIFHRVTQFFSLVLLLIVPVYGYISIYKSNN